MKNRKIKGLIGLILFIVAIVSIYFWESYFRKELTYDDVIVFRDDVPARSLVTLDMLSSIKIETSSIIPGVITDPGAIIGKETKHFIPKNLQLHPEFFDDPEFVLAEDEFITVLPAEWVYAFPSSLRRKDIVYIYLMSNTVGSGVEINPDGFTNFDNDKVISIEVLDQPVLYFPVVYVKDRANREVIGVSSKDARLDGSSQIAEIHIITNLEKLNQLNELYNDGYSFLLMYKN